jgi:hypothetical protein
MNAVNRQALKNLFKNGAMPKEGDFHTLIDSMYNKVDDDDLSSQFPDGSSADDSQSSSLFAKILNEAGSGMAFNELKTNETILQLKPGGNVGIGVVAPLFKLHVNGTVAAPARVGTYTDGKTDPDKVLANGQWQPIIQGLDGLNAFEVVASVSGVPKSGNYALLHAIALSTFGKSKNCIVQHSARYKGICKNIQLRWTGDLNKYNLEIRTKLNFGAGIKIKYNITQLIC